jgi:hypothetical protein
VPAKAKRTAVPETDTLRQVSVHHDGASSAEIRALEQRLKKLEAKATQTRQDDSNSQAYERDDTEQGTVNGDPMAVRHEQIQRLDRILNDESYDPTWSSKTEEMLQGGFAQRGFDGSTLRDTKCGTSFCRMNVRHRDHLSQSEFETFSQATGRMGGIMLFTAAVDGQPETTLYLVRKELDSPDHPVRRRTN